MENEKTVVETPEVSVEPTTTQETVTSPEVKVEVPATVPVQTEDASAKMQTQIDNLNIALKQEREAGKTTSQELADKLANSQETIDKLRNVFVPEQQEEQQQQQENLTMDQIEDMMNRRDNKIKEESQKEIQAQTIKEEVTTLEGEWNGENGKPQYDDKKVLQWQEDNSKLHLSPSEAFNEMSRDTIIDWEIKNRLAKKPEVQSVETPGGTVEREPEVTVPKTAADVRNAVVEAMSNAGDENIN